MVSCPKVTGNKLMVSCPKVTYFLREMETMTIRHCPSYPYLCTVFTYLPNFIYFETDKGSVNILNSLYYHERNISSAFSQTSYVVIKAFLLFCIYKNKQKYMPEGVSFLKRLDRTPVFFHFVLKSLCNTHT